MQVLLANSRNEGSVRDPHEDTKMLHLFIVVPKSYSEDDVKNDFSVCVSLCLITIALPTSVINQL